MMTRSIPAIRSGWKRLCLLRVSTVSVWLLVSGLHYLFITPPISYAAEPSLNIPPGKVGQGGWISAVMGPDGQVYWLATESTNPSVKLSPRNLSHSGIVGRLTGVPPYEFLCGDAPVPSAYAGRAGGFRVGPNGTLTAIPRNSVFSRGINGGEMAPGLRPQFFQAAANCTGHQVVVEGASPPVVYRPSLQSPRLHYNLDKGYVVGPSSSFLKPTDVGIDLSDGPRAPAIKGPAGPRLNGFDVAETGIGVVGVTVGYGVELHSNFTFYCENPETAALHPAVDSILWTDFSLIPGLGQVVSIQRSGWMNAVRAEKRKRAYDAWFRRNSFEGCALSKGDTVRTGTFPISVLWDTDHNAWRNHVANYYAFRRVVAGKAPLSKKQMDFMLDRASLQEAIRYYAR